MTYVVGAKFNTCTFLGASVKKEVKKMLTTEAVCNNCKVIEQYAIIAKPGAQG